MAKKSPQIAIVYDKVSVTHGGAERVLQALHQAFPSAPLYTSLVHPAASAWSRNFIVQPSFLQYLAWIPGSYRILVPLFPLAFESLDLSTFDIIISVTSGEAKGILTKPKQLHICYLLTPPRYLFSHAVDYLNHPMLSLSPVRWLAQTVFTYLRWWDRAAAQRPDVLLPISTLVSQRAQQIYQRIPEPVLYPPTPDVVQAVQLPPIQPYLLSVSRLVPYKRVDLSILACIQLNKTLIVVGTGMEQQRLIQLAGKAAYVRNTAIPLTDFLLQTDQVTPTRSKVLFVGSVTDTELSSLYQNATALLMPGIEDYGIAALEAALWGIPTIMHSSSGAAELLPAPELSISVSKLTSDAMIEAIEQLQQSKFTSGELQKVAKVHTFSYFQTVFKKRTMQLWHRHNQEREL